MLIFYFTDRPNNQTLGTKHNLGLFREGVRYNDGRLIVSRPGLYYVYAVVEGDPRDGHMRAGFSLLHNETTEFAWAFFTRENLNGTHDDLVMYAGAMRHLNAEDSVAVRTRYTSYYEIKMPYCFGLFFIP